MKRLLLLGALLGLAACASDEPPPQWRADCPPTARPSPLSLEAARDAHRIAARRQAVRAREAAAPGSFMREMHAALDVDRLAAGDVCLVELAERGQMLFEHEFGYADGLGGGKSASAPAGPFRRVHEGLFGGPETVSCTSCHWVGGPNGAGAETDNAFLSGDGVHTASGDERNPPALVGLGVVEALGREMTRDLQRQRADLVRAGKAGEARLTSKGVGFGVLRVSTSGEVDVSGLDGVDADLVVKPFGWKGTLASFAAFGDEALQIHMGVQSEGLVKAAAREVIGTGDDRDDPDGDGMRAELGRGPFAAMSTHMALLELPIVEPLIQTRQIEAAAQALLPPTTTSFAEKFQRGRDQFHALGCAGCHQPMLVLESPILTVDGLPPIDLARDMRQPGLRWDASVGGYPVWLFSDLKRHDMGPVNAARHVQHGVAIQEYLTPRLWGIADSAPYLHDGRAPSFDYAIAGHDGEGAQARAAYAALDWADKGALRVYLMSLRRASRVMVP